MSAKACGGSTTLLSYRAKKRVYKPSVSTVTTQPRPDSARAHGAAPLAAVPTQPPARRQGGCPESPSPRASDR
eukprot:2637485-Pyramimonas_sp.AAC.3